MTLAFDEYRQRLRTAVLKSQLSAAPLSKRQRRSIFLLLNRRPLAGTRLRNGPPSIQPRYTGYSEKS